MHPPLTEALHQPNKQIRKSEINFKYGFLDNHQYVKLTQFPLFHEVHGHIMDAKKISIKKDTDLIKRQIFDDWEKCDRDYSVGPNRTAISR